MGERISLKRSLSTPLLVLYGLGNILGAGIYVLIGEVAAVAGYLAPLSFATAAIAAGFTAFSYAELSSRYPVSAGEAVYLQEGYGRVWLSRIAGLAIALAGMVSAATIARGFTGYLQVFVSVPDWLAMPVLLLMLGAVAAWGISESVWLASLFTLLEIAGLLLVLFAAGGNLEQLPERLPQLLGEGHPLPASAIMLGAFLAFYAFLGFEDMVNVAEEVVEPQRSMPRAIMIALIISTLLYASVAIVAVLTVPPEQLGGEGAPLALIYETATGERAWALGVISLFAVVNGALIQIIMASRMFYGMARRGWLPAWLGWINRRTRTPMAATLLVTLLVILLSLSFDLVALASITSTLLLLIFALINGALLRIRHSKPEPEGVSCYPAWVPICGLLASLSLLGARLLHST